MPTRRCRPLWLPLAGVAALAAVGFGGGAARDVTSAERPMPCAGLEDLRNSAAPGHDRAVAAWATDIFVGRLLAQEGPIIYVGTPIAHSEGGVVIFAGGVLTVEVLEVVKGSATGTVEVISGQGDLAKCERDQFDAPLRVGDLALFLTQRGIDGSLYLMRYSDGGYFRIDDEAERTRLVARFAAAAMATPIAAPGQATPASGLGPAQATCRSIACRW